jgi:hypothetical protein
MKSWHRVVGCCLLLAGCGGSAELPKVEISGHVTYNGKPVQSGEITFLPMDGTKSPPTAAVITNGEYRTATRGNIAVGKYRVEIREFRESKNANTGIPEPAPAMIPREQLLPARFNVDSTMELVVGDTHQPITKDYDLKNGE